GLRRTGRRPPLRPTVVARLGGRGGVGGAPARRRGDEEHGPARARPGRRHRDRVHRLVDLEVRGDVPARLAGGDRRRLPGLRRPLEPDPRSEERRVGKELISPSASNYFRSFLTMMEYFTVNSTIL